jgi:hypothetical protein
MHCPAETISVFDVHTDGTERMWVASCEGETWDCSESRSGESGSNAPDCTRRIAQPPARNARVPAPEASPTTNPMVPFPRFPRSAAGFFFGQKAPAVEAACTAAGHVYQRVDDARATCDGPAADIGLAARVTLEFCEAALCGVGLLTTAKGADLETWVRGQGELVSAYAQSYGPPQSATAEAEPACDEPALPACYLDGRAQRTATWAWSSGETLSIRLRGDGRAKAPKLALAFRAPRGKSGLGSEQFLQDVAGTAAEASLLARAKSDFAGGVTAFEEGRMDEALEAFRRSRATYRSSVNTLNIGLCLHRLGRVDEALEAYEDALAKDGPSLAASERDRIAALITVLRGQVGTLEIVANVPATLVIEGHARGALPSTRPLRVTAGKTRVLVLREGYLPVERNVVIVAHQTAKLEVTLTPVPSVSVR